MTVKEFVEKYNNLASEKLKDDMINKSIVLSYLNYEDKCDMCARIISSSNYDNVNGEKIFKQKSTSRYMLTVLSIIDKYTKIDINFAGKNVLSDFNMLDKLGLIDGIINAISKTEITKIQKIMEMQLNDLEANERNIVSFIEKYLRQSEMAMDLLLNNMSNKQEIEGK